MDFANIRVEEFVEENQDNSVQSSDIKKPTEFQSDSVSALNGCQSNKARKLCIFDLAYKLEHADKYDIGGTYTDEQPDLWFYFTTALCPYTNYIMNLFVCHRQVGSFTLGISETKALIKKNNMNVNSSSLTYLSLPDVQTCKTFRSFQPGESHHIKTFSFSREDIKNLNGKTLCIPIQIEMNPKCSMDKEIVQRIKESHDLSSILKKQDKIDFTLKSQSGKQYPTHKIVLAAHSPILRDLVKTSSSNMAELDINDDDMNLLLEFLYTGTIKNILKQNCCQILEIAQKFKLENLFSLTQFAIGQQITVKNAMDIAVLSEKYKLDKIQKKVFDFIKIHPEVLETDGWKNLSDVVLTKKLFREVYLANN